MTWGNGVKSYLLGRRAKLIGHCLDQGITLLTYADISIGFL